MACNVSHDDNVALDGMACNVSHDDNVTLAGMEYNLDMMGRAYNVAMMMMM